MQNLYIKSLDISGRVPDLTAGRYIDQPHRQRKVQCKKFVSFFHEGLTGYFYVISRAEYVKNSKKIPADTLDLENLYFKVKDTSVIFSSIFFVFSPSNYVGKYSEILAITRNEI